jgi:hypothetical protein
MRYVAGLVVTPRPLNKESSSTAVAKFRRLRAMLGTKFNSGSDEELERAAGHSGPGSRRAASGKVMPI